MERSIVPFLAKLPKAADFLELKRLNIRLNLRLNYSMFNFLGLTPYGKEM